MKKRWWFLIAAFVIILGGIFFGFIMWRQAMIKIHRANWEEDQRNRLPSGLTLTDEDLARIEEERKNRHLVLEEAAPLVAGSQKFSFAVYRELLKDNKDENLFFSPMSLYYGLSMVAMGTKERTQRQMLDVLSLGDLSQAEKERFRAFGKYFQWNGYGMEYFMMNRIWHDPASPIHEAFENDLKEYFGADSTSMNLKQNSEASRQAINRAIEGDTKQRIKNLLPSGSITPDTACILTNTMFFHGEWMHKFKPRNTKPGRFFLADGTKKTIPMMAMKMEIFDVYRDKTFQAISLGYQDLGDRCSMVILLPNKKNGLPALEEKLTPELWTQITGNMEWRVVDLKIPKFRIDTRLKMKPVLKRMGMTDAFIMEAANFTGMSDSSPMFLQDAAHGAVVEVDEIGTVAAAATGEWVLCGIEEKTVVFHADHPFLFVIRDDKSGAILFMGRFVSP